ncbi:conserved exported hypothetical protein [Candidatus Terasakiella magnetica]|nr:conserved exported hypothetical protein [Candidatus Terasakiella magnetica]
MSKMTKFALIATVGAAALLSFGAQASDVVEKSFLPYKAASPTHTVAKPGAVITAANVDQAKDVLDPAMYEAIKAGWYEMKVGATTSFDVSKTYVEATEKNLGKVQLGDKLGEIKGFIAGRPFPEEPQTSDQRAGEKIAWNFKYGINWGDSASNTPTYWSYRTMADGKVERVLKMSMHWLNFMHRTGQEPMPNIEPNPSEMYRATYVKVLEPQDVADTQLLIHRYEDDTKLDSTWLYLGFQRRVRKLSTGQITDSFLGSDNMIEDFEGYNGRISDMKWTFKGTRNILMPFYNHNEQELAAEYAEPNYKFVDFTGKGSCFPKISWQIRKAYEVDVTPIDANHPVGKRTMFFDAQTMAASRTITYDRSGKLWKNFTIGKAHPDHHLPINKGTGIALDDMFSMIDVQAQHCTTGQFKGQVDPSLSPASRFSVDAMRSGN